MALEKYTTTVVGAYSLPRWYEVLEKQVEAGRIMAISRADAYNELMRDEPPTTRDRLR